jgi:hypothetical protein
MVGWLMINELQKIWGGACHNLKCQGFCIYLAMLLLEQFIALKGRMPNE